MTTRCSKDRSSRSPFVTWTALFALLTMLFAGCDQGSPPLPSDFGGTSDYVGASICQNCHTEVHALWSNSKHSHALAALQNAGYGNDSSCLPCHTTGFGHRGFVSATLTPGLADVQCEACHGPGAKHVGSRNPADILRVPGTEQCGICHTGPQQPNHEEWTASKHASALQSVRQSPQASDNCLSCHSLDYWLAVQTNQARALRGLQPLALPSVTNDN